MAISKEFLSLFTQFVTIYKKNGTPTFLTWAKEQKHSEISTHLEELQGIVTASQELFNDSSIIEHLSCTVLLSARTNPYLVECWIEFLREYNTKMDAYGAIGRHIPVGPEGKPSERIIRELQQALRTSMQLAVMAAKTHESETELLKKEIEELKAQNKKLVAANSLLQQQIEDQTFLKSLEPKIEIATEQVGSFLQLLSYFKEVAQRKPGVAPALNLDASPIIIELPPASDKEQNNLQPEPSPKLNPPQVKSPPPPPPTPKRAPAKPQAAASGFFTSDGFKDELTSAIKQLKSQRPTEKEPTGEALNTEKKNRTFHPS